MSSKLLSSDEAAKSLGISVLTLYEWLGRSDCGEFCIRGQPMTIEYLQGGAKGQGRIRIEEQEVERLKEAMRVRPQPPRKRRPPSKPQNFPGITVPLGRPDD
ncbi:MAG: DNA-binding protein [Planctomycetota bacterium]|nr:MAG: DNA-binding protein [Planctomycetota bacterium]REJ88287.1 MAG: DNA-binding protein [Planctomycetota bacterium]REK26631.1 MAG: DNA-binding protein [Planctomycetota bacterium]REK44606.1 MAG: DNA-binding protein [Planctomycetota bacterium]